jgi:hypothetical protein
MDNQEVTQKIREVAKKLLSEGKVSCVIGFEKGTVPMRERPFFAYTPKRPISWSGPASAATTWLIF